MSGLDLVKGNKDGNREGVYRIRVGDRGMDGEKKLGCTNRSSFLWQDYTRSSSVLFLMLYLINAQRLLPLREENLSLCNTEPSAVLVSIMSHLKQCVVCGIGWKGCNSLNSTRILFVGKGVLRTPVVTAPL